jgi:hypothetical protein
MTALKPIESRRVRGVASERYPLNAVCAHPECKEPVADPHHSFPRSQIGGDSWFVEFWLEDDDGTETASGPLPHVTGLCRAHHDDVEEHRAWIKYEGGEFVWYDKDGRPDADRDWSLLGPLNPQPGSREGKPKKRRKTGEARRQRAVIAVRVPKDEQEDGGAVWDEALAEAEQRINPGTEDDPRPPYYTIIDALHAVDPTSIGFAHRIFLIEKDLVARQERGVTQVRITTMLKRLREEF